MGQIVALVMKLSILSLTILAADAFTAPQSRLPASQGTRSAPVISMLKPVDAVRKLPAAATALAISAYAQAASAKSGVGGEGTGKALGANDDSLLVVLGVVFVGIGFLFAQWQEYQDDDEDFFDTYDSRRDDREVTNRNRV